MPQLSLPPQVILGYVKLDKAKTQTQKTNMVSVLYQSRTHPTTDKTRSEVIELSECGVCGNIFLLPLWEGKRKEQLAPLI